MKQPLRKYPGFSLCGLNCLLCPMHHISKDSYCTGCGGTGRGTCPIMRCAKEHGDVAFCIDCSDYPCARYLDCSLDSFVPRRNIDHDFQYMKRIGLQSYLEELQEKEQMISLLLQEYNDGRHKSFYCTAINLLDIADCRNVMKKIADLVRDDMSVKGKATCIEVCLKQIADDKGVDLRLHKKVTKG